MEKKLTVSCKGPKGNKKLEFTSDFTIGDFISLVSTEMGIDEDRVIIKLGFPPKPLNIKSLDTLCINVGIKDREAIHVAEDSSAKPSKIDAEIESEGVPQLPKTLPSTSSSESSSFLSSNATIK